VTRPHAAYKGRRVAGESAVKVTAVRFTASERGRFDELKRARGITKDGDLLRALVAEAPAARVGLSANASLVGASRWLVEMLDQPTCAQMRNGRARLRVSVERAVDDVRAYLDGETPDPPTGDELLDGMVARGDLEALEQFADQVSDALALLRRRAEQASPAPPSSGVYGRCPVAECAAPGGKPCRDARGRQMAKTHAARRTTALLLE